MKLTTTRLLAGLFVVTAIGVTAGLLALHERERPEDPRARPVGPSSIIRGVADVGFFVPDAGGAGVCPDAESVNGTVIMSASAARFEIG